MAKFDPNCTQCPRLADFRKSIKKQYPDYHAKPVPSFGDKKSRFWIIGLAPGLHGANATGRPFTGDYAGILLYETLFEFGFSNKPESKHRDDKLKLNNCCITNAVKCVPPQNKPESSEITQCNVYLKSELDSLADNSIVLALGRIAHQSVLKALNLKQSEYPFQHAGEYQLHRGLILLDSYHCSRYNTQTNRLTKAMFQSIFRRIRELLDA